MSLICSLNCHEWYEHSGEIKTLFMPNDTVLFAVVVISDEFELEELWRRAAGEGVCAASWLCTNHSWLKVQKDICSLTAHRSLDRDSILRQTILPNGQMGENVWESMYGVFENNIFYCVVWNKIISLFIQSYNLFM